MLDRTVEEINAKTDMKTTVEEVVALSVMQVLQPYLGKPDELAVLLKRTAEKIQAEKAQELAMPAPKAGTSPVRAAVHKPRKHKR